MRVYVSISPMLELGKRSGWLEIPEGSRLESIFEVLELGIRREEVFVVLNGRLGIQNKKLADGDRVSIMVRATGG